MKSSIAEPPTVRPAAQQEHPNAVDARELSCQGLTSIDVSGDRPMFYGQPVDGHRQELDRRGEDHVLTCDVVGHRGDPDMSQP